MRPAIDVYTSRLDEAAARDLAMTMQHASRIDAVPRPLPDATPPAPFDMALLPASLRPWVEDIAERLQCPPDMLAVTAMVGAGSILGNRIGIRPQENSDWTECPNLWGMIVGRPGTMKSPAMSQALAPLRRLQAQARDVHAEAMTRHARDMETHELREKAAKSAALRALSKNAGAAIDLPDAPEPPTLRRYIANDSNIASLGELLRQNPSGILIERDELVGLLRGLDQEERAEERAFYLTGWNGRDGYTFDRIMRGLNLHIPKVTLSVIGGAQPGRIADYLRAAVRGTAGDDGLMQRFSLLVWPDHRGDWRDVDRWPDNESRNRAFAAFDHLDKLTPEGVDARRDQFDALPYLRLSPAGLTAFRDWRTELERRLHGDELHPAMASHLSKYRKAIPAMALILHLIDGGIGAVSEAATLRALAWSEYLESHAVRAYASVTNSTASAARLILKRARELPEPFTARDVYRSQWSGLTDRETVRDALDMLADYGQLIAETLDTGGRPSVIYRINPGARA
jgi:putative DNA primase/helicase